MKTKNKEFQLPGTFVLFSDVKSQNGCLKKVDVTYENGITVVLLKDKKWTLINDKYFKSMDVYGCVGGYSLGACTVARCLAKLGVWSEKAAEEFVDEYHALSERMNRTSTVARYLSDLETWGYNVSSIKESIRRCNSKP